MSCHVVTQKPRQEKYQQDALFFLLLLAQPSSVSADPWTYPHGSCIFSGDDAGAPLNRTGVCPTFGGENNWLWLVNKGITSLPAGIFDGMACT